jgi:Spy/CpxP family protein refolding chaperone
MRRRLRHLQGDFAMKKLGVGLVVALALVAATAAVAQEKPKAKGKGAKLTSTSQAVVRMDKLRETLEGMDLSAEQKEKLTALRDKYGARAGEVLGKIRDALTEEQRTAAEEAMKKAREAGKKGRDAMLEIEAAVKLTDAQKEQLAKIDPEIAALHKEVMKDIMGILSAEQKQQLKEKMSAGAKKPQAQGEKKAEEK